jgi:hypothetical protein
METYIVRYYQSGQLKATSSEPTLPMCLAAMKAWEDRGLEHMAVQQRVITERKLRK